MNRRGLLLQSVCLSVCLSVCVLVTTLSPEPIQMSFGSDTSEDALAWADEWPAH